VGRNDDCNNLQQEESVFPQAGRSLESGEPFLERPGFWLSESKEKVFGVDQRPGAYVDSCISLLW
jgi:hypothetical protein